MKKTIASVSTDVLFYIIGCFVYSAGVTVFISNNGISPGGVTGISTVINYLFGFPIGIAVFLLNVPILILGFIKLGGRFILKTAAASTVLSVMLEIADRILPAFKGDKILAALFGGILMGSGLSLVMLRGATTGGVDILAKVINIRFRHFTVGRLILVMDCVVILIAALVYRNAESALYSVISLYTSSTVFDTVIYGADKGKMLYIVTSFPREISKELNTQLGRGVTQLNAIGAYTGEERTLLMCTLRNHEVAGAYRIIDEYDKDAFVVAAEAGEIIGNGFKQINK